MNQMLSLSFFCVSYSRESYTVCLNLISTIIQTLETRCQGVASVLFFRAQKVLFSRTRDWQLLVAAPLLFIMTTLVSSVSFNRVKSKDWYNSVYFQHLVGVIIRSYRGFISYPAGPVEYFKLIHTRENTLAQAGQVGAIILTDMLSVSGLDFDLHE